jgi:hypothetical protein
MWSWRETRCVAQVKRNEGRGGAKQHRSPSDSDRAGRTELVPRRVRLSEPDAATQLGPARAAARPLGRLPSHARGRWEADAGDASAERHTGAARVEVRPQHVRTSRPRRDATTTGLLLVAALPRLRRDVTCLQFRGLEAAQHGAAGPPGGRPGGGAAVRGVPRRARRGVACGERKPLAWACCLQSRCTGMHRDCG